MSNTFGTRFRLTAYGESHGHAIGGVVDGCPSGIIFDTVLLASEMQRRHVGTGATPRHESDEVEILSGIYDGKTLGTPIAFTIRNRDVRNEDYASIAEFYRPGHADYTYQCRYGRRDPRGGGRASGRETAVRVVGGAIAKMVLQQCGIAVNATLVESHTPAENDSVGGVIKCVIDNAPAGIGDPVFGKLNARLAAAMMSIPSATGFEMGAGFEASRMAGSQYRDDWAADGSFRTETNNCGGIQGGISNGMPIEFRVAFHPATTVNQPTNCIDSEGIIHTVTPSGRHDRNHLDRTVVVVEAMAAMTIADYYPFNHQNSK